MAEADETRALDSRMAERLAGPALPFSSAAGGAGVTCRVLPAPEGVTPIPLAVGAFPWRLQGALRLTVIAKASFAFTGDPPAALPIAADPLQVRDVHHKHMPLTHVVAASDRVPWRTAVDVTLLGQAHAPGGRPTSELRARLAVASGGSTVLDKSVRVVGDRGSEKDPPKPFTRMPITYERTFGGPGAPMNPIGCGGPDDDQPNILDPVNPWKPTGFGPIPVAWPLRHKLLGDIPRRSIDAPVMDLPAGFPFAYFQSAPQDQQIPVLAPDAVVLLEGFRPDKERVQLALPGARAVGAVYGLDADPDAPAALPFRLDTLHVDADRLVLTLTWRAYVHLNDEAQIGSLLVAVGAGVPGHEPVVPARRPTPEQAPAPSSSLGASAPARSGTSNTLDPVSALTNRAVMPFASAAATLALPTTEEPAPPAPLPPAAPYGGAPATDLIALTVAAPEPAPLPASALFHDLSKLPTAEGIVPRAKDEVPGEAPPEQEIDLERYAGIAAQLDEKNADRGKVLEAAGVDAAVFRKAERHWKNELKQEIRRGDRALRDRFDDAYVTSWEKKNAAKFGAKQYARLKRAEQRGRLQPAVDALRFDPTLAMRLRRVWRRRVDQDPAVREAVEKALAEQR